MIKHEENGLLVPVGDKNALAAAINRLIEDRKLAEQLGRNAVKIGQMASPEHIFGEWEDYIKQITRNYRERTR